MKVLVSWTKQNEQLRLVVTPVDVEQHVDGELLISDVISQGDLLTEIVQLVKPEFKYHSEQLPWNTDEQIAAIIAIAEAYVNGLQDSVAKSTGSFNGTHVVIGICGNNNKQALYYAIANSDADIDEVITKDIWNFGPEMFYCYSEKEFQILACPITIDHALEHFAHAINAGMITGLDHVESEVFAPPELIKN